MCKSVCAEILGRSRDPESIDGVIAMRNLKTLSVVPLVVFALTTTAAANFVEGPSKANRVGGPLVNAFADCPLPGTTATNGPAGPACAAVLRDPGCHFGPDGKGKYKIRLGKTPELMDVSVTLKGLEGPSCDTATMCLFASLPAITSTGCQSTGSCTWIDLPAVPLACCQVDSRGSCKVRGEPALLPGVFPYGERYSVPVEDIFIQRTGGADRALSAGVLGERRFPLGPKTTSRVKTRLVNAYLGCNAPNSTGPGAFSLPACDPAALVDPDCHLDSRAAGFYQVKKGRGINTKLEISGIGPACHGETLTLNADLVLTTTDCATPGECTTVLIPDQLLGSCVVNGHTCKQKRFINMDDVTGMAWFVFGEGYSYEIRRLTVQRNGTPILLPGIYQPGIDP